MKARLSTLSPTWRFVIAGGAIAVYAAVLWLLVVSPKRSEAADLRSQVAAADATLAAAHGTSGRPARSTVPVSDLFRLAKAMPSSNDQSGLVLELDQLAERSGVTLGAITLQDPVITSSGATMVPVAVEVGGSYRGIERFLGKMRQLVGLSRGNLRATGRLFTVQSIDLSESKESGFPLLDGSILLNAYVYDGPVAPPVTTPPSTEGDSTTGGSTSAAGASSP